MFTLSYVNLMIGQTLNIKIKLLNQQIILKSVHLIYEFSLQSKQKFHEKINKKNWQILVRHYTLWLVLLVIFML